MRVESAKKIGINHPRLSFLRLGLSENSYCAWKHLGFSTDYLIKRRAPWDPAKYVFFSIETDRGATSVATILIRTALGMSLPWDEGHMDFMNHNFHPAYGILPKSFFQTTVWLIGYAGRFEKCLAKWPQASINPFHPGSTFNRLWDNGMRHKKNKWRTCLWIVHNQVKIWLHYHNHYWVIFHHVQSQSQW